MLKREGRKAGYDELLNKIYIEIISVFINIRKRFMFTEGRI